MRILHTMLRTGNLERSIQFYTEILGMKLLRQKDYPEGKFSLAFIGYGDELDHKESIFTPLNMHDSGYEDSSSGVAAGYTYRYATSPARYVPLPISDGEGQLYSTTEDLLLWDQALYTERLLPRAELDRMLSPIIQETNVAGFAYGYGWYVGEDQGRTVVGHGGNIEGFATLIIRYPEDQITLIVLMNQADSNQLSVWAAISNEIFGEAHAGGGSSDQSRPLVSVAELCVGGDQ